MNTKRDLAAKKRAKRMALASMHGAKAWSDGQKVFEGSELREMRRRTVHDLVGMSMAGRDPVAIWKGNSFSMLKLFAKQPSAHGLPEDLKGMLRKKTLELYGSMKKGVPSARNHFLTFRRMARAVHAIERRDLPIDQECAVMKRAIERVGSVRVLSDMPVIAPGPQGTTRTIKAGSFLTLDPLGAQDLRFDAEDGTPVRVPEAMLGRLMPCKLPWDAPELTATLKPLSPEDCGGGPEFS